MDEKSAQRGPIKGLLAAIALLASATACSSPHPLSGTRIVEDLNLARVPVPDDAGRPPSTQPTAHLPETGPISLADLLNVAEVRSPDLAAARSDVGIAAGQAWQASLYPNPTVFTEVEDISWNDGLDGAKTVVGVSQPIILGDRRIAAMRAATAEQAARMAEVDVRRRTIFGEISALHASLVSIREQERIYGELRELASRTLAAAETRFEAKAAPETDVIKPRVELYRIDAALARLAQESSATSTRLGLVLGGVSVDASRLDGSLSLAPDRLDVDRLNAAVRASHPSLIAADRAIESAAARVDQVKAEKTPDLDVSVAAGYRGESDDGIVQVGAGMTIPLWDERQGEALSSRFALMRARQRRLGSENEILGALAEAAGEYEAAKAQLDTFRDKIVPDARRAFDQTGEGYRAGRATFLDLLDAQRTLTEARVTLVELASAVTAARAKVVQIVGPDGLLPTTGSVEPRPVPVMFPERHEGAEVQP